MTSLPPSRNAFADPTMSTFANLLERLKRDRELPKVKRQNWMWALKTVARAAAKDPAEVLAHPQFVRKLIQRAAPGSIGLSRASWNNARSLLGKVLEWAGLVKMPAHYLAPFAPSWAALMSTLPGGTNAFRFRLYRLPHYCSAQGIDPDDVDDQVLTAFHDALTAESIVDDPYVIYRRTTKSWNHAAERIPGWPQQRLTVPSRKEFFAYHWEEFPASLKEDVEAYFVRALGLTLDDDHFTRAQRPSTVVTRRRQLLVLATAIAKSGIAPETLTGLAVMLQPKTAGAGLQYLVDRNGGTSCPQISNIATYLPTLARRLDLSNEALARLRKMALKLKVTQRGLSERNREALRAFDDVAAVEALVNLPARVVDDVLESGRKTYRKAKLLQTALAIELLLGAPVRIQNLASIEVDRHLVDVSTRRERRVHLRFPAHEVKNSVELDFPLMPETLDLLDQYMAVWRPILCKGQDSPFLFPGVRPDRPKWKKSLSGQIKELVFARTRLAMTAHRFRHAGGKIFLDQNPGQYEVVRQLLGHKDIRTTIAFYAGAETASAIRHYARTILGIRHQEHRVGNP
jgi:integrase